VSFMGTTEVPVGLFIDAVTGAGKWDEVRPLLANYPAGGYDTRSGPRVWEWSTRPGQVMSVAAPGPGDTSRGWLRAKSTTSGQEYYPPGLTVTPPTPQHPMQYVSPTAAVYAARLMGCRLPTSAEWKAAAALPASGTPNLRDKTWRKEFERAKELVGNDPEYPAGGIFWPSEAQKVQPLLDGSPAVDADDGVLWFSPAEAGVQGFQNLVGNVAEFVWEDPASIEAVEASSAAIRTALGKGEKLRVIGGSALSPKEVGPNDPQPVNFAQARAGYSDVGFRLAFSAPRGAAGADASTRLDEALNANGYLTGAK
jgi:formylglycine-generating enzyme required for sulfatase activity